MAITTTTNKLRITELDFDNIKAAFRDYLSGQTEFTDYNFESSGMSILLDLLAYNTHYNAFYTNMLASEMFMDSAGIRSNVVSRAKQLGYIPFSRQGAEATVDFTFLNITSGATEITIPKGFKVSSKLGDTAYSFLTTEAATATVQPDLTTYHANNVIVREGVSLSFSQLATGLDNELFTIPNEFADTRSFEVTVNGEKYNFAENYTEVNGTSKVYFLQEGDDGMYQIYFGDGVIGKDINGGDLIAVSYTISRLGLEGNGATIFKAIETIAALEPKVNLTNLTEPSSGGVSREQVSSIKLKAPRGFEAQKRVVTKEDYITRLVNDYPYLDAIQVWGGEDNDPPDYGKVYVVIKVADGYALSSMQKEKIKEDLKKRSIATVSTVFLDPEFLYLVLDASVNYDGRATTKSAAQLKTDVVAAITGFAISDLNKFQSNFRHSNLLKKVDNVNVGILNNSISVKIKKVVLPTLNTSLDYIIRFDNELYHPHSGHMPILASTYFNHSGYGNCYLEDVDGVVRVVTIDENSRKIIVNRQAGTVDYQTGKVTLFNFTPTAISDGSRVISIVAVPKDLNIVSKLNSLITISSDDLKVELIDDNLLTNDVSPNY